MSPEDRPQEISGETVAARHMTTHITGAVSPEDAEPILTNDEVRRLLSLSSHAVASRPPRCEYIHAAALTDLESFLRLHDHALEGL